jgi:transcriptional regulator with XRE-family HTH domain
MLNDGVNHAMAEHTYPSSVETMGDRIKMLRRSQSLSMEAMGKIVGVSAAAVAQWETGATTGIKPENFLRFCAYFGADPYWVCFGEQDPRSNSSGRFRKPQLPPR